MVPSPWLSIHPRGIFRSVFRDLLGIPFDVSNNVWVVEVVEDPVPQRTRPHVECVRLALKGELKRFFLKLAVSYRIYG
jgi:hypothetical protein